MGSNARGSKKPTAPVAKRQPRSDADLPKSLPSQPEGLKTSFEGLPEQPAKMGRPTKYRDDFPALIIQHFTEEIANGRLPFLSKFARLQAMVCEDTAIEWCKEHPDFSEAYKIAKNMQKEFLIQGGLEGKLNSSSWIFTAKNIAGMRDQTETIFPDKEGNPQEINPAFNNTERAARMIFLIEQATRRKAKE